MSAGLFFARFLKLRIQVNTRARCRIWGLYEGDELLAVTVYRKGAEAVRNWLQEQEAKIARLSQAPPYMTMRTWAAHDAPGQS